MFKDKHAIRSVSRDITKETYVIYGFYKAHLIANNIYFGPMILRE